MRRSYLTRKDYKRIAQILKDSSDKGDVVLSFNLLTDLMNYFQEDNPAFDRDRFIQAVDND